LGIEFHVALNILLVETTVDFGILYYMKSGDMFHVPGLRDDIRHLIVARNDIATYMISKSKLPPMIKNAHACQRCYQQEACFVYHKVGGAGGLLRAFGNFNSMGASFP
jgi:CRISPR/Cas system-associated exonuclease Cas4 (RecB family)